MTEDNNHESTVLVPQKRDDTNNSNYDIKLIKKKKKENNSETGKERDFEEGITTNNHQYHHYQPPQSDEPREGEEEEDANTQMVVDEFSPSVQQLSDLPDQVLALVFAFADFSPSLFLVCKRWYKLYFTTFQYQLLEHEWVETYVYSVLLSTIPRIVSSSSSSSCFPSSPSTPHITTTTPTTSTSSSSSASSSSSSSSSTTSPSNNSAQVVASSSSSVSPPQQFNQMYAVGEAEIRNRATRVLTGLAQMLASFPRSSPQTLFRNHTVTNSVMHIANDLGCFPTLVNFLSTDERMLRDPSIPTLTRGMQLLDLPHFVILRILEFLPMKSLCTVTETCKTLASIGSENSLWIRRFERRFGAPAYDRLSLREKGGLKRIYANWSRFTKTTELSNAPMTVDYFEPNYCTFRTSGRTMMCQRFFVCKTCWPRDSKSVQIGCCVVCAHRCHLGHNVVEISKCTQAYCDCGEGTLSSRLPWGHCGCMN